MYGRWIGALAALAIAAQPASAQRILQEWRVRTTAGPEALAAGPAAVFWNPAQVRVEGGRAEVALLDLRAPRITGIDGLAAAVVVGLRDRTTLGVGYEHVAVSGVQETASSPDDGGELDLAEDRLGLAVAHEVSARARVGALVQYTRLPKIITTITGEESVLALGAGIHFQPLRDVPLFVAGMGATEGDDNYWMAGVEFASPWQLPAWRFRGEYGAAGGHHTQGLTHRVAAAATWRDVADLSLGAAIEPNGGSRSVTPTAAALVRLNRYRLGVVREQLANDFGGAYSFRFSVSF